MTPEEDSKDAKDNKRHVSFCEIHVVELPVILGDHPCCRDGLPVQPGWEASDRYSVSIDTFEATRLPQRRSNLFLPKFHRVKLIRNVPFRDDEANPRAIHSLVAENSFEKTTDIKMVEDRLSDSNTRFSIFQLELDELKEVREEERIGRRRRHQQRQRQRQAVAKLRLYNEQMRLYCLFHQDA
ncbi:unnamed protein product [Cylindrotheca closterium]|uniref:Uncharacterized protein n=1 Tax=Cylindrotheca closterium TaxID=2856 RepID=A0AAD2CNS3_9STRA|nr:unnamed protein product [Cylindrotheca closterium]